MTDPFFKFWNAIKEGNAEKLKLLLPQINNPAYVTGHHDPVYCSAFEGNSDVLQLLLEDGRFNPSYGNNIAIRYAAEHGHEKCVQLLLNDRRVDPAALTGCPVKAAYRNGHHRCVELLLKDDRCQIPLPYMAYSPTALWNCVIETLADDWISVAQYLKFNSYARGNTCEEFVNKIEKTNMSIYDILQALNQLGLNQAYHRISEFMRLTRHEMITNESFLYLNGQTDEIADDDIDEIQICVVCQNNLRKCVIKDCGHAVLCVTCAKQILIAPQKQCPICSQTITMGIHKFYL